MSENKTALLVGSTGLIGNLLLKDLLNDDYFQKIEVWVRRPLGINHPKLIEKIIDFNSITNISPQTVSHIFCCLGTTIHKARTKEAFKKVDFDYVVNTAEYAGRCNAEKFIVVSSIGANKNSSGFYLRVKGDMEEAIKKISIPGIYILRPSLLLGKRNEFRLGEIISKFFMTFLGLFLFGKFRKFKAIRASVVAKAMIFVAIHHEKGIFTFESDQIEKYSS
jgi:hypothetical protein